MRESMKSKYERLTVVEKTDKKLRREYLYKCICECGNVTYQTRQALESGHVKSCGCLQKEKAQDHVNKMIVDGSRHHLLSDKPNKNNETGFKGVSTYQQTNRKKYKASLYFKGKTYSKKGFATADEAYEYRKYLEEKYLKNVKKPDSI